MLAKHLMLILLVCIHFSPAVWIAIDKLPCVRTISEWMRQFIVLWVRLFFGSLLLRLWRQLVSSNSQPCGPIHHVRSLFTSAAIDTINAFNSQNALRNIFCNRAEPSLFFDKAVISSREGTTQGDPLCFMDGALHTYSEI